MTSHKASSKLQLFDCFRTHVRSVFQNNTDFIMHTSFSQKLHVNRINSPFIWFPSTCFPLNNKNCKLKSMNYSHELTYHSRVFPNTHHSNCWLFRNLKKNGTIFSWYSINVGSTYNFRSNAFHQFHFLIELDSNIRMSKCHDFQLCSSCVCRKELFN